MSNASCVRPPTTSASRATMPRMVPAGSTQRTPCVSDPRLVMKRPSFGAAVFFGACQNHGVNDSGIDAWLLAQGERTLVRLHAAAPFDVAAQAPLRRLAVASDFATATLMRQPDLLPALLQDSAVTRPPPALSADNRSEWQTLLRRYRGAESTRLVW